MTKVFKTKDVALEYVRVLNRPLASYVIQWMDGVVITALELQLGW